MPSRLHAAHGESRGKNKPVRHSSAVGINRQAQRDPEAYLREVVGRIADHPFNRIAELLPWNIGVASPIRVAA
jgi:transposase